jgi:hypothetical protein
MSKVQTNISAIPDENLTHKMLVITPVPISQPIFSVYYF